jgi:photosystem II stability/assembly factor-like uncharacterized protein
MMASTPALWRWSRIGVLCIGAVGLFLFLSVRAAASLTLHHIHGLSYSTDGQRLYIPMHHGLAIYSGSHWSKAPGPEHDYMGFAVTHQFLYSSGHPAPGTPLKNPFGLIKSPDQGQTWEQLGLTGEADFHLLATGYHTNTVYVFNPTANSRMPQAGLYSTSDDGKHWRMAKSAGLAGSPASLAVHPAQDQVIAVGTRSGVYLSQDAGEHFQRLADAPQVLAVFFTFDGQDLWFSSFDGKPALTRIRWQTGQREPLELPSLDQDTVTYVAQNPVNASEWAIATYKRDVYVSSDNGTTWKQIAKQGETL